MFFGNRRSQFERRTTVSVPFGALLVIGGGLLGPITGAAQGMTTSVANSRSGRRRTDPVRKIHPREWPDGGCPHRPQGADRGGQRLVSRGFEERIARQDGVCPPVRTPDVPGLRALRRRVLQAVRAGRRNQHERHDQLRPHQLFPERADDGARPGALDGIGSHGSPARRRDAAAARRAAWRGQEREATGRESSLRPRVRDRLPREFPAGSSLPHAADRLDDRPRRRDARRRARLVPHVLRRSQRSPGAGRRHRRADGARQGRTVLRTHRPGSRRHPAGHVDRRSHRQSPRDAVRPGRAATLATLLEHAARQHS